MAPPDPFIPAPAGIRAIPTQYLLRRQNVIAGIECGFGTFAGRVQADTTIVWMKRPSLVESARRASAQLWAKAA